MRYLVVTAEGGLIQEVEPFDTLKEAKTHADNVADAYDRDSDDLVVWDLQKGKRVYQPLA